MCYCVRAGAQACVWSLSACCHLTTSAPDPAHQAPDRQQLAGGAAGDCHGSRFYHWVCLSPPFGAAVNC